MMMALRRASYSTTRSLSYCVGARACCAKLDVSGYFLEQQPNLLADGSNFLSKKSSRPFSFSAISFLASRTISSQTGAKTSDNGADLEDGFSELECPPEINKAEETANEEDSEQLLSEQEDNLEEDSGEVDDISIDDSKTPMRKSSTSPLFQLMLGTPRHSLNAVLDKWVEEGNTLGHNEIATIMLSLRRRHLFGIALQLSEFLEAKKHLEFVERDYVSRVDLIAKVQGISKAEKYIEQIPESFRSEVIYRTLLANCVSALDRKKTEEVFNKIRELGLPLTAFACNQLLMIYKSFDRKKIADVLLMMEKENVKPTLLTYRLLVEIKGHANDIEGMEQVLEAMQADNVEPDIFIQAKVARYYIFGGCNEKAEAVLKKMEGDDIKKTRDACKFLLPLYASLGKVDDVERLWKVCEEKPMLHECLAVIVAWGKLGRVENAEAVFERMVKTWKRLSSKYYNAMLKVYADHNLLLKGKDLIKRMSTTDGCKIGPTTWDAAVRLYLEAGEVEKADSVLQKAAEQNRLKPMYATYLAVLEKYAKRGDVHNAEKIFYKMRMSGYTGKMRMYQALLEAYINAKMPAYGFRERMKADNLIPKGVVLGQLNSADGFRKTKISELID